MIDKHQPIWTGRGRLPMEVRVFGTSYKVRTSIEVRLFTKQTCRGKHKSYTNQSGLPQSALENERVGVGSHISSLKVGFIIRFFYRAVLMNASSVTLMFCLSSDRFIAISDVRFFKLELLKMTCHCNMWNHTKPKPVPRSVPPGSFHYHLFPACFEVWFELVVTHNMLNQDHIGSRPRYDMN